MQSTENLALTIDPDNEEELQSWLVRFGVNRRQLINAIEVVGPKTADVKEFLATGNQPNADPIVG